MKAKLQKNMIIIAKILEFSLTLFSIPLLVWQGWIVTEKFLSKPEKSSTSYKRPHDLLQTDVSICYVSRVTDCSAEEKYFSLFDEYPDYYDDDADDCVWKEGEIGNFGNSTDFFWKELETRGEPIQIQKLTKALDIWNPLTWFLGGFDRTMLQRFRGQFGHCLKMRFKFAIL